MVPRGRQIGFCLLHQLAVRIVGLLAVIAVYGIFAGALEYQTTDSPLSTAGARHLLASPDQTRTFTDEPARTISSYILSVLFGAVATACGIGGGPFFVPLFTYDLGFSVKGAAALSQVVIAAGALSGVGLILHKKSPLDDSKPLINYDLVLLMLPALLMGVSLGVLGNKVLPTWLITILLLLLLVWLTEKMFVKAFKVHASEKERAEHERAQADQDGHDCEHDEGQEQGGAGPGVQKVPSAPGGLQSLGKDSSSKISGTSTSDKHDKRSEKSLVLPPEVSATLEAILESNADGHLDVSSSTVRKLAVQSPFSAANGVVKTKGGDEAGTLALGRLDNSVGASESQRAPSCSGSSREQSDDELLATSSKRHPIQLPELTEPLRQSGSFRHANSSSLQRMFSRPRPPGAGRLGKSSSMKPGAAAAKPEPMRRAVSITLGEPRKDAMLRSRRLETFVSTDYLPYFDTRPLKEVLAEAEGGRIGEEVAVQKQVPVWAQAALLASFWLVFLLLQVLLSLWSFCSPVHWPIYGVLIICCCAFEALHIYLVRRSHQGGNNSDAETQGVKKAMQWTTWALMKMAMITLVCGFIAGLFGIGGGVVLGPLLLSFGTHAKIAAATSNLMVLFSSAAAAIVYGLAGDLNLQISLIFGISCAASSLFGVFIISRLIDRSGKASILIFLLSSIIALGALMTGILGLREAILDLMHHNKIGFSGLCGGQKA